MHRALAWRVASFVAAVAALLRGGVGVLAWRAANKLERPTYETLRRLPGGVELRRCAPSRAGPSCSAHVVRDAERR